MARNEMQQRTRRWRTPRRLMLLAIVGVALAVSHVPVTVAQDVTSEPTQQPTEKPTEAPTTTPTSSPTSAPTEKPTEAPTSTPTPTPSASPTEEPTPAPTPTLKPSTSSSGSKDVSDSKDSDSGSASSSGNGDSATPKPVKTKKTPATSAPATTTKKPSSTTPVPTDATPEPTDMSDDADNASNTNKAQENSEHKMIAIIVVAGIAAVCALGLVVICLLRRKRDDLDDMASPVPILATHTSAGSLAAPGARPSGQRGSMQHMGPGPYPKDTKLSINTSMGIGMNGGGLQPMTSPAMPANYRTSNRSARLTNLSRTPTRAQNNASFTTSQFSETDYSIGNTSVLHSGRTMATSNASTYSVNGGSHVDPSPYMGATPGATNAARKYRFTSESSVNSLHDSDVGSVINRGTSASSVDQGYYEDPTLSQSIGGSNVKNWYNPVESPATGLAQPAHGRVDRESEGRGSFEL